MKCVVYLTTFDWSTEGDPDSYFVSTRPPSGGGRLWRAVIEVPCETGEDLGIHRAEGEPRPI